MLMNNIVTSDKPHKSINISLDFRLLSVVLALVIVGLVLYCRPWEPRYGNNARTVVVTGMATLSATPDEFVFNPTYDFTDADQKTALANLTAKSSEIVGKLKALGVPSTGIKTNTDSYSNGYVVPVYPIKGGGVSSQPTYTLRITVTLTDSKLVQKVQDYLVSTTPTGQVSPQADFSQAKQDQLENQARDAATKDARSKAEQSAKDLGFSLGAVKNVQDGEGFGGILPLQAGGALRSSADALNQSLPVDPGQNQLSYTVTVTYFLR